MFSSSTYPNIRTSGRFHIWSLFLVVLAVLLIIFLLMFLNMRGDKQTNNPEAASEQAAQILQTGQRSDSETRTERIEAGAFLQQQSETYTAEDIEAIRNSL